MAKLCLWLEWQQSPVFISYWDLKQMHLDANKIIDREGWIQLSEGNTDKVAHEDYIWAGSVSRYRMEIFS